MNKQEKHIADTLLNVISSNSGATGDVITSAIQNYSQFLEAVNQRINLEHGSSGCTATGIRVTPKPEFIPMESDFNPDCYDPLGPENVPPGSVIRIKSRPNCWAAIVGVSTKGITVAVGEELKYLRFSEFLKVNSEWQIKRPDKKDWHPCAKLKQSGESAEQSGDGSPIEPKTPSPTPP